MDFETLKKYYNRCSPLEFLEADDDRYVAVDELGDEGHRVRGEDWSGKLVRHIMLSKTPVCELLTGLPGSGKSTELRRVAQRLEKTGKYLPIVIDAEDVIDLNSPIDVPDIIIAVLYEVERGVLRAEGKDPDKAGEGSFFERVKGWGVSVELKANAEVSVPFVGKLAAEMKYNPSLRERVRSAVARHVKGFLEEARKELLGMNARVEKLGRAAGIVVIFDTLEKLRGVTANYLQVLQSAEQVFQGGAPYLHLPVHVLYTVPAALVSRRRFEAIEIMPMIKLQTREGQRFEPGFEAAKKIVHRRIPPDALQYFLGEQVEPRLLELITWSGGYPRELVRFLQQIVGAETFPLSEHAFRRVINEVGDQYRGMIFASAYPWLARVAVEKPSGLTGDDNHRDTADKMLANNAILRYLNDSSWFDLHPAVRQIPGVQAEIKKLERERASQPA